MSRQTLVNVLIVLAVIGLADSLYLAVQASQNAALFCDIGAGLDGCNEVAQSPYSRLFGIPLAYLGVVFYALLLIASVVAIGKESQWVHRALLFVAGIGAIFSVVFLYIQLALIQALCVYCIASAAIAFLSLAIAYSLDRKYKLQPPQVVS
jgi:uncharacterized membrane protein